jgi:hypothetical protein
MSSCSISIGRVIIHDTKSARENKELKICIKNSKHNLANNDLLLIGWLDTKRGSIIFDLFFPILFNIKLYY